MDEDIEAKKLHFISILQKEPNQRTEDDIDMIENLVEVRKYTKPPSTRI